ncbi:dephospho-CoA kinase [Tamilnaduibacter salinus]|uniref:Dephospho-CoA kinase n=1 Tax=Tamilnaduibacter salinus TaxID=1484056 RepID=A0A2A2I4N6_9GAMM|nr:dephospho-CoA kinase [Tamilnaduibacter salinus]PAV26095.1 dephospho-CoA kinase [Tamilnaduibacter salinus]
MKTIGLTGGIGSGKSTVARLFQELGVHAVDADDVAREVVEPGAPALAAIADHFGKDILQADGALDRAALRSVIFETPSERDWLEKLLHPIIEEELTRQLWIHPDTPAPSDYAPGYTLLVSPLLLETDQHHLVEQVIVVDVPESVQIQRTTARDDNTPEQVRKIIDAQMPRNDRLAKADIRIDNDRDEGSVRETVKAIHRQLTEIG